MNFLQRIILRTVCCYEDDTLTILQSLKSSSEQAPINNDYIEKIIGSSSDNSSLYLEDSFYTKNSNINGSNLQVKCHSSSKKFSFDNIQQFHPSKSIKARLDEIH